jgi:general L-amino acid transport system substrate-binding protein
MDHPVVKKTFAIVLIALWSGAAHAGPVLDQVKKQGFVSCGAAERPGVAYVNAINRWDGIAVDVCRAVATAVLGSPNKVAFSYYEMPSQFARIAAGADQLFFLSGTEIQLNDLGGKVLFGPTIFYETHRVMVPVGSKAQNLADLAGVPICTPSGSRAERSLSSYFQMHHLDLNPSPYTEDGEMLDAYAAKRCGAVADEATSLAQDMAAKKQSRLLPETTAVFPIMAGTSTRDAQWAAIVAWTVDTLIAGERPETLWYAGGAGAMPVKAPELGLDNHWQAQILAAVGDYGAIYDRHLGKQSGLNLPRGPNDNQANGGLLLAPFLE